MMKSVHLLLFLMVLNISPGCCNLGGQSWTTEASKTLTISLPERSNVTLAFWVKDSEGSFNLRVQRKGSTFHSSSNTNIIPNVWDFVHITGEDLIIFRGKYEIPEDHRNQFDGRVVTITTNNFIYWHLCFKSLSCELPGPVFADLSAEPHGTSEMKGSDSRDIVIGMLSCLLFLVVILLVVFIIQVKKLSKKAKREEAIYDDVHTTRTTRQAAASNSEEGIYEDVETVLNFMQRPK